MASAKWPGYITCKADTLPQHCPALWDAVPVQTYESAGLTRLTCPACGWTERYKVVDRA